MFNKEEIIKVHKMMAKEDPFAAALGSMQIMSAGLDNGAFTPHDCADIISAVFDRDLHNMNMALTSMLSD